MNYMEENGRIWNERSKNNDIWSRPVTTEEVTLARKGIWNIVLTPQKKVPKDWFPVDMFNKKVLCLAGGGGQQGPIIAATGAIVTVFDYSEEQLAKDRYVAKRDGLNITTVQGNMQDLSVFEDESFDIIIHPWSNGYVDSVLPVWQESYRILKKSGMLLSGFGNPIEYIFDTEELEKGKFIVKYKIPYADIDHLDNKALASICESDGYIFGHSLEDQIQGQIAAGFVIAGFYEDCGGTALDEFINSSIVTKAVKL